MKTDAVQKAARALCNARTTASALDELPAANCPPDVETAYEVQQALHDQLHQQRWGNVVGHKIGCTTDVMQQYLGISTPCAGKLFDTTVFELHGEIEHDRLCHPGVECEIAVRLGQDLVFDESDVFDLAHCRQHASSAVNAVMASIELVDARWQDYTQISAPCLIADDFFGAGCVLGSPVKTDPLHIDALRGEMWVNDQSVGVGSGSDILGHPLDALVWLAQLRASQAQPLRAGEFVTLGSLVQTQWIEKGDEVRVTIDTLGSAVFRLV